MLTTPMSSKQHSEDEASIASSFEANLEIQEECPISFWLSGPEVQPSQSNMLENEESVEISPKKKTMCHNKGKKKMTMYGNKTNLSEQSNSSNAMSNESEPPQLRSDSTKRAMRLANENFC